MADVRPFRALRYRADRVDLAAVVASSRVDGGAAEALIAREPRNVVRLARPAGGPRRARFLLAEWQRAGIVARDERPALYGVRRTVDGAEPAVGFFARVPLRGPGALPLAAQLDRPDDAGAKALTETGVVVEPVLLTFADDRQRVGRAVRVEMDREPDLSFPFDGALFELWSIDDETTVGRVGALLASASLRVARGGETLARHAAAAARTPDRDDDADELPAAWHALAFCIDEKDEGAFATLPLGAVLGSLEGSL